MAFVLYLLGSWIRFVCFGNSYLYVTEQFFRFHFVGLVYLGSHRKYSFRLKFVVIKHRHIFLPHDTCAGR